MSIMMLPRSCVDAGFTQLNTKTILEELMLHNINEDLQIIIVIKSNNGYSAQWGLTWTERVLPTF